jgi:hypothetical protein
MLRAVNVRQPPGGARRNCWVKASDVICLQAFFT